MPLDIVEADLGNLNECCLSSGVLLLDTLFNLKQHDIRKIDIPRIREYFEVSHYKLQKLFCWRQRLFNCKKPNTVALKPHASCHFSYNISEYGATYNTDTVLYENLHIKKAKEAYKTSSRRNNSKLMEMTKNVQFQRLVRCLELSAEDNDENDSTDSEADEEIVRNAASAATYSSPNEVIFEGCRSTKFTCELILRTGSLTFKTASKEKFLSPNTTLDSLWTAIKNCRNEEVRFFCDRFGIDTSKNQITYITKLI